MQLVIVVIALNKFNSIEKIQLLKQFFATFSSFCLTSTYEVWVFLRDVAMLQFHKSTHILCVFKDTVHTRGVLLEYENKTKKKEINDMGN